MSSMYEQFRSDSKAEQEGIILDYGTFRVTVARAGGSNKKYLKLLEKRSQAHLRAIQTGNFDNAQADQLLQDVYTDSVILNWEVLIEDVWKFGIESPEGDILPVSKENMLGTFKALPDLWMDIREQAQKGMLYRASLQEEAAKNS